MNADVVSAFFFCLQNFLLQLCMEWFRKTAWLTVLYK